MDSILPICCPCGRQLHAQKHRLRSGQERYVANCANCGRLLRKKLPERNIELMLTAAEFAQIDIGAPFRWSSEQGRVARSEEFAIAYHVDGMPRNVTANLIREGTLGYWMYVMHTQRQSIHSEWCSLRKEHALEDLKMWLRNRCTEN